MIEPRTRTLHVIAPTGPTRRGLVAGELIPPHVAACRGAGDHAILFGDSRDRRSAIALGLIDPLLAPMPRSIAGVFSSGPGYTGPILSAARTLEAGRVVLWSPELLPASPALARAGFTVEASLLDAPDDSLDKGNTRGRRALGALTRLITPDHETAEAWTRAGAERVARGLPDADVPLPTRREARDRLGLHSETAIVPLCADPGRVDARALMFVSGVLDLRGFDHALVLPDRAERLVEALRFRRRAGLRTRVVLAPPPWLFALPAADLLVEPRVGDPTAPGAARGLLHQIAGQLGLPVDSTAGWDTETGLGHGTLPPDIRQTVGPVLARIQSIQDRIAAKETA